MSLFEAQRFYQKLQQDSEFFELFNAALQNSAQQDRDRAIVQFAKEQGFHFELAEFLPLTEAFDNIPRPLDKRANIHQTNTLQKTAQQPVLSVNKLEQFFIWLSGSSPRILATCPESEQKKHAALGGAVLIPALLAIVTASFLLYTLNFSIYAIVPVALLWSGMILLMDRALLATYRRGFSFWGKLGQFSLRFGIALLIAVTVAHPVVLLLFSERIDAAYNESRIKSERAHLALQCDLKNPQSDIRAVDEKISQLRIELKNSNQLFEPPVCGNSNSSTAQTETPALDKLTKEIDALKAKQAQANQDAALFTDNAEKEKQGLGENGFTGLKGCKKGSQCKRWLSQASDRKDDSIRLGKEIVALEGQIEKLNEKIANHLIEAKQLGKKQCDKERDELKSIRTKQHDMDQQSLASLNDQRSHLSRRCAEKDSFIANLKPDILTQTELLTQLMFPNHHVSWHNLLIFLIFMLLFLAIDMLAVVLKMARVGIYETKVDIAETHDKLLDFINQRHETVARFSEVASKEQQLLDDLKVRPLKQELDTNFKNLIQSVTQADRQRLENFFKD